MTSLRSLFVRIKPVLALNGHNNNSSEGLNFKLNGLRFKMFTTTSTLKPAVQLLLQQKPEIYVFVDENEHSLIPRKLNSLEDVSACLHGNREGANQRFKHLFDTGPTTETEATIHTILCNETFHVNFVRKVTTDLSGVQSDHDWSKDFVYMVTAAVNYSLKRNDLVGDIVESEIERHFQLEGHHPEHVDYSRLLMDDSQILEMAVDRLSRSLQFHKGVVDMEDMKKYTPFLRKCPICGNTKKCEHEKQMLEKYWSFVDKHYKYVEEQWQKMATDFKYVSKVV